jgi:Rrf2 family transcriptional regulator, cysteine metabolism repressor
MKITFKGDYALKAVLDLAIHYNKELVTGNELAKRIDAPVKFLEQVLLDLKKGGFIESRRGNIGGYFLFRSPAKITVGEVIRFIEGPIEPLPCVNQGYTNCKDIRKCVFKKIWKDVSQATSNIVDKITFEDLAAQVKTIDQAVEYSI